MPAWILRLGEYDERLLHAVVSRRMTWLDYVVRVLTHLGDPPVAIGLAGGIALGLAGELEGIRFVPAFALAFSFLLSQVLKRFFSRTRPDLPVGISSLIQAPDRFSFPSGHATGSLSIALPLALVLPMPLGIPVLVLGMAVGLTRCYLGVHFPGDVFAGWGFSIGSFRLGFPASRGLFPSLHLDLRVPCNSDRPTERAIHVTSPIPVGPVPIPLCPGPCRSSGLLTHLRPEPFHPPGDSGGGSEAHEGSPGELHDLGSPC